MVGEPCLLRVVCHHCKTEPRASGETWECHVLAVARCSESSGQSTAGQTVARPGGKCQGATRPPHLPHSTHPRLLRACPLSSGVASWVRKNRRGLPVARGQLLCAGQARGRLSSSSLAPVAPRQRIRGATVCPSLRSSPFCPPRLPTCSPHHPVPSVPLRQGPSPSDGRGVQHLTARNIALPLPYPSVQSHPSHPPGPLPPLQPSKPLHQTAEKSPEDANLMTCLSASARRVSQSSRDKSQVLPRAPVAPGPRCTPGATFPPHLATPSSPPWTVTSAGKPFTG